MWSANRHLECACCWPHNRGAVGNNQSDCIPAGVWTCSGRVWERIRVPEMRIIEPLERKKYFYLSTVCLYLAWIFVEHFFEGCCYSLPLSWALKLSVFKNIYIYGLNIVVHLACLAESCGFGRCIVSVMRPDRVSRFRWLNSDWNRAGPHTDIMMWDLNMMWDYSEVT